MSDVRTRWHDFMEAVADDRLIFRVGNAKTRLARAYPTFERKQFEWLIRTINTAPKYFFTMDVVDMIGTKSTSDTIHALQQFKLDKLPHETCLVEFQGDASDRVRHFVLCLMRDDTDPMLPKEVMWHPFTTVLFTLYQPGVISTFSGHSEKPIEIDKAYAVVYPTMAHVQHVGSDYDFSKDHITEYRAADNVKLGEIGGIHTYFSPVPYVKLENFKTEEIKAATEYLAGLVGIATRGLVAMLRTQGVERSEVSVPRLNKARLARKRTAIPDHTVVKFGHYYKSNGQRGNIDPNAPRRSVRMHVRSAHVKMQPYGPGRKERKCILVEACLVNYDPASGEAPPVAKRKVVKA